MKKAGYLLFACLFHLFRIFPIKRNLIFMVATHDDSKEGNIGMTASLIKEKFPNSEIVVLTREDEKKRFSFLMQTPFMLARAKYVFLDNAFLPLAYLHFSRKAKVVQLWHGTGTIKRFGQDVNTGGLKKLEYRANQRLTHLIVNSEYTKRQYAQAFGVKPEIVHVLGLPRTDFFFDEEGMARKRASFLEKYPDLAGKTIFLYAPTFRDNQVENPEFGFEIEKIVQGMPEESVLLLRLHPHVAQNYSEDRLRDFDGMVYNMSQEEDVSTLLVSADVLITDYSSIIFEYCLLNRQIIFYAYDLKSFEQDGRSFYEPYRKYVPGPVVETEQELLNSMNDRVIDLNKLEHFRKENFAFLDGKATERLLSLIMENSFKSHGKYD